MIKSKLVFGSIHKAILDKAGKTLDQLIKMDDDAQNEFIHKHLNDFLTSSDSELSSAAEDLLDMMKYWEVGQREQDLEMDSEAIDFLNSLPEDDS